MRQSVRIVSWILTAPIVLLIVLFSISNLDDVTLHLKPLPFDLLIPIWTLTLIVLFAGFLLGAIVTWIGDRKSRRDARALGKRVNTLEQSLAAAQSRIAELEQRLAEQHSPVSMAVASRL